MLCPERWTLSLGGPGSLSASRGLGKIDQHPRAGGTDPVSSVALSKSHASLTALAAPVPTGKVMLWAEKPFGRWTKPRTGTRWQKPRGGSAAPADLRLWSAAARDRSHRFASQPRQPPRPGRGSPALDGPLCCSGGTPPALMPLPPNPDTAHPSCQGHPPHGWRRHESENLGLPSAPPRGPLRPLRDLGAWSACFPESAASVDLVARRRQHRRVRFPALYVSVLGSVSEKKPQIL